MTASSPIADLSYRNYEGPLAPTNMRWWVIAKATMRAAMKKKSLWVLMTVSSWYYIAMITVLYFLDQMQASARPGQPDMMASFLSRIVWKDQFIHGFSYGQMWLLLISLLVGAGQIANDNRSNALLVYLSKPCTKTDYLLGKFVGVFLMILMATAIPALLFFGYGAMTFRQEGFFYQDYYLFPKLIAMLLIGSALHASLMIGFSSMFSHGRLAGATYAGLYFVTTFFSFLMYILYVTSLEEDRPNISQAANSIAGTLTYFSVDGLNIAMAKAVLSTNGSGPFGGPQPSAPMTPLIPTLLIVGIVCFVSLFIAWTRIKAVEVVG